MEVEGDDDGRASHKDGSEKFCELYSISNISRVPRRNFMSRRHAGSKSVLLDVLHLEKREDGDGFSVIRGKGNGPS